MEIYEDKSFDNVSICRNIHPEYLSRENDLSYLRYEIEFIKNKLVSNNGWDVLRCFLKRIKKLLI